MNYGIFGPEYQRLLSAVRGHVHADARSDPAQRESGRGKKANQLTCLRLTKSCSFDRGPLFTRSPRLLPNILSANACYQTLNHKS